MDGLMQVFPIMMYVLGSILLVVTIILVIKLIYTVDKANEILDNVEAKVKTLDGFFNAINMNAKLGRIFLVLLKIYGSTQ